MRSARPRAGYFQQTSRSDEAIFLTPQPGFVSGLRPGFGVRWSGVTLQPFRAGSGFDRRGPREHVINGGLLEWSTTVKTRPDEPLFRDETGLVLPAIVVAA